MKLSRETLSILKNFATINDNLTIKPGNKLVTISAGKNIVADISVTETFETEFGIYDLSEFLGVLSLFENPELVFSPKFVTIKEGKNAIKYFAADTSILTIVPNIKPFPTPDIEFELSNQIIAQVQKVASVLKVPDFSIAGDGTNISIMVGDKSNPTGNTFNAEVGTTDKNFKLDFKVENLKFIPGDYKIAIGNKKIARFQATSGDLFYLVALELTSTFED